MKMMLLVLHDPAKLQDVLDAWQGAGAEGVTILFSTGIGRIAQSGIMPNDLPLMPSLSNFFSGKEHSNRTLFTILKDEALLPALIEATHSVVGDFNQPNTGLLVILPVDQAEGLEKEC
jgi:hypothetical protein